jgi:hypothetical protein
MKKLALLSVAILMATFHPGILRAELEDIVVVVNKANPAKTVSRDDIRPIFQTTKSEWPGGTKAEPVNLPDDSRPALRLPRQGPTRRDLQTVRTAP